MKNSMKNLFFFLKNIKKKIFWNIHSNKVFIPAFYLVSVR